jgi:LacI family transcriptional regulator
MLQCTMILRLVTIQKAATIKPMSAPPEKRPTLKTLAEITGLGISTVSQALRDSPEIAADTKQRVKLAARQAGYRPNRAGVRLRTGKSNVITVVLNPQDDGSGFFANFIYGIADALVGTTYQLVVTPYSLSDPMAPIRSIIETSSADGVILSRTQQDDPRLRYLQDNDMPFATHGRTDMAIDHCYFDFDNEAYAIAALGLLKQRGRQKAVLFNPPPMLNYYRHTLAGYEEGLRIHAMTGTTLATVNSDSSSIQTRAAALALAQRDDRPDAVVCTSARQAVSVVAGLKDGGMEIGRDYDLVAKQVTELVHVMIPEMLSIPEDYRQAGFEVASMLIARIAGEEALMLQKVVSPEIAEQ